MDFDEISQILEMMREHGLAEFELEREGLRVRLRKDTLEQALPPASPAVRSQHVRPEPPPGPAEAQGDAEAGAAIVKSPVVGTFYRASEPSVPPFVDVGSRVTKGQVLCIIEAMKLMNEIDSEYEGEITRVFVENGQPVQYGDSLFAIKTAM